MYKNTLRVSVSVEQKKIQLTNLQNITEKHIRLVHT